MKGLETRYEDVDLVIVRENTEDLYAGIEHMVGPDAAESIKIITRAASERIARFAFDYAVANGRRKVTAVHKANIMKLSDGLFLESCRTVAAEYDGRVEFEDRIVDNMCMQLVQKPELYDVLVLPNLYGDIVSATSRPGWSAGSASRPARTSGPRPRSSSRSTARRPSTPGSNKANPTAMILSGALMLRHLGLPGRGGPGRDRRARRHRRGTRRRTTWAARPAPPTSPTRSSTGSAPAPASPDDRAAAPAVSRLPRKPAGTAAAGPRRHPAARRVVGGARASRALLFTVCATYLFISGILLTPLFGTPYEVDGYLSPLFSPLIAPGLAAQPGSARACSSCGSRSASGRPATTTGRRTTGSTSPIRRAARSGEPTVHRRYAMEAVLPFILQNVHRYFLYLAFIPLFFLWVDAALSLRLEGSGGSGSASSILVRQRRSC